MKKLLLKSTLLVVLSFILMSFISDPFFKKFNTFEYSIKEYYKQSDSTTHDILILGSSHARNTYNTKLLNEALNVKSFNLGSGGQSLFVTNYLIEDLIKKNKPKLIILDVFPRSLNFPIIPSDKSNQLTVFDYSKFSFNKLYAIREIYNFSEYPSVFSTTLRNHDNWYNLKLNQPVFNPKSKNVDYANGFIATYRNLNKQEEIKYSNFKEKVIIEEDIDFDKEGSFSQEFQEIQNTIDICKSNNIELIITSAPYLFSLYSTKELEFHKLLKLNSDKKGWNVLDFNLKFWELDLELSDFMDRSHLNAHGANKVTNYLILYLYEKKYFDTINNEILSKKPTKKDIKLKPTNNIEFNLNNFIGTFEKYNHEFISELTTDEYSLKIVDNARYIVMRLVGKEFKDVFKNKEFGVHFVFNQEDYNKRPKWMLGTDRDRETYNSKPEIVEFQNNMYLVLKLEPGQLNTFKQIRLFLKDKGKFKGVIGKTLEIDNATFKN